MAPLRQCRYAPPTDASLRCLPPLLFHAALITRYAMRDTPRRYDAKAYC